MIDLEPCPFCGSTDVHRMAKQDYGSYHKQGVRCDACRFTILYECDSDDESVKRREAAEKWNRRDGIAGLCWFCGSRMIWDSDFNRDEVQIDGPADGVVAYLHCSNEECGASAMFCQGGEEEEEERKEE